MDNVEEKVIKNLINNNVENPIIINQEIFDKIIDILKLENEKELMLRLCLIYEKNNFKKIIDYYVEQKDSYYIQDLVSMFGDDLNQEYLVMKLLETKDKIFIKSLLKEDFNSLLYTMDSKLLEKLIDYAKY